MQASQCFFVALEPMAGATSGHFLLTIRSAILDEVRTAFLNNRATLPAHSLYSSLDDRRQVRGSAFNDGFQVFVRKTDIFSEAPEGDLVLPGSLVQPRGRKVEL